MFSHAPLTVRAAVLFFVPLILMTELHQLSHALVHAFLARLGDATTTLAAFSVAFAFNTTFSGLMSVQVQAGMSYITDKRSFWRIARFYLAISLVPFLTIESVALTPLGDWLFMQMMGASAEVTRLAKGASAIMGLWILPNQVRNLTTALCMMHRRTMPISHSTIIRLASQAGLLLILPWWLEGALAGAASLVGCMTVEAAYMYWVSRGFYKALPRSGGEQASYRQVWTFSWPLMITQITENGVSFVINFFLGRLAHPDLALAAFGVVNALKSLVASPLRNMVQTAQALVHTRHDMQVMLTFAHRLTIVYVLLVGALFYTPMRDVILGGIMGLPAELRDYAIPGVQMMLVVVVFWGYASLFRGLLSAMRKTHAIAGSAVIRLLVVTAVGSVTLVAPDLNGAAVGVAAVGGAFLAEALILGWQVARYSRTHAAIFPREKAA
jgi:O-antigen/teichoic acid export membrane protein